jgi:hypothetical protein
MIRRRHTTGSLRSEARFSECCNYRYALTRVWDATAPRLMFVMLNPSTADERKNDPTVARCESRARALGYGAFRVTNLFAWRATDPRDLRRAPDPAGPDNAATVRRGAAWADAVLCAWGVHGAHLGQADAVAAVLRDTGTPLYHLGLTQAGHPRHPLYVGYDQPLIRWIS